MTLRTRLSSIEKRRGGDPYEGVHESLVAMFAAKDARKAEHMADGSKQESQDNPPTEKELKIWLSDAKRAAAKPPKHGRTRKKKFTTLVDRGQDAAAAQLAQALLGHMKVAR